MSSLAVIRAAEPDDTDAIARIWYDGWPDGHRGNVPEELLRFRTRESFRERAAERIGQTWVAAPGSVVAGFVVVVEDEIEQVYLDREYRGSGIAGSLLQHACAIVAANGHSSAWLAVVAGNARARAFYARQGWRDEGRSDYPAQAGEATVSVPVHTYRREL